MPSLLRQIPVGVIPYVASSMQQLAIPRELVIRVIALRLTGQLTCAKANNVTANVALGDEWGALAKVELVANSRDVLCSVTGNQMWWLHRTMWGGFPKPCPALLATGTDNPTIDSTLFLPVGMSPGTVKPADTCINPAMFTALNLQVTWGSHLTVNTAATGWTTAPQLAVHYLAASGQEGPFHGTTKTSYVNDASGANSKYKIDLPANGPMYRGLWINTAVAGQEDSAVIDNIKIVNGPIVFYDAPAELARELAYGLSGVMRPILPSTFAKAEPRCSTKSVADSWHYVNLIPDGYQSEALDTLNMGSLSLELNVLKAGQITVIPDLLYPVRNG